MNAPLKKLSELASVVFDGRRTGYVQPKINQLREVRGRRSIYHNNAIQSWKVAEDGEVTTVQVY